MKNRTPPTRTHSSTGRRGRDPSAQMAHSRRQATRNEDAHRARAHRASTHLQAQGDSRRAHAPRDRHSTLQKQEQNRTQNESEEEKRETERTPLTFTRMDRKGPVQCTTEGWAEMDTLQSSKCHAPSDEQRGRVKMDALTIEDGPRRKGPVRRLEEHERKKKKT